MTHELKISPEYFKAVKSGHKKFELRKDDRNFREGDLITLKEYKNGPYTGEEINNLLVLYILRNCNDYGLKDGYCILGF